MKKQLIISAIAGMLLASTAGCSEDKLPDFYNGTGLLDFTLEVVVPAGVDVEVPAAADFSLELTSDASPQNSCQWRSFAEFESQTRYLAGTYTATAVYGNIYEEGFDAPCFGTTQSVTVTEGTSTTANLTATMLNVPVTVAATDAFTDAFPGWSLTVHAEGGSYTDFTPTESRTAFLRPEPISVSLSPDAEADARFLLMRNIPARSAMPLNFSLDAKGTKAILICGGTEIATLDITPELLAAPAPKVTLAGHDASQPLNLPERTAPDEPLRFIIDANDAPAEALLTIDSQLLAIDGAPKQIDLANPSPEAATYLRDLGIHLPSGPITEFDLTPLLSHLQFRNALDNTSRFSLEVTDASGRQSKPVTLTVNTVPVGIEVISATSAIIGINQVDLIVATSSPSFMRELSVVALVPPENKHENVTVVASEKLPNGTYRVTLLIPEGNTPLTLLAYYGTELKAELKVERISPAYTIDADPFASWMKLRVDIPGHDELRAVVTRELRVEIDNADSSIIERDTDEGIITITGLRPSTLYTLSATLQPGVATATHMLKFTTEAASPLPNGDFEDVKKTIKWKNMPAGGRYSQTLAEIFNCQNHTTFDYYTPTGWANTNPKTFYTDSKRPNTWYMQPSVFTTEQVATGDYAVELVSTSFNHNGPAIPEYLQESVPYVRYSRNIPDLPYRAAGKIFLGEYSYDPLSGNKEIYKEGIAFTSRPESLNGFYVYLPCPTNSAEKGLVTVEVIGEGYGTDIVIASGRMELPAATGYTAFSIPLTYTRFGVKAKRVKVMCATSNAIGSISHESANVAIMPDPETSSALGSRMRLDNLTFAY